MKGKTLLLAFLMGIVIPSGIFTIAERFIPANRISPPETNTIPQQTEQKQPIIQSENKIPVLQTDGTVVNMELEEYLVGVILGEMPLDFDMEALKAQAVVARTYTMRRNTFAPKHTGGAVCVEPACCQSYCKPEAYLASGGTDALLQKAVSAISATAGQVITYNGALIEATYYSCSGGRTEDAVAVWGTDIPYLQAVDSPGEENADHYRDTVILSKVDFVKRLGINITNDTLNLIGPITYTDGGGVDTIIIAGVSFKGTQLRQKLGIRSTAFTITILSDSVYITTKGFGHRVGMSQYGAEAMAVSGNSYEAIIAHYYPGTELVLYNRN